MVTSGKNSAFWGRVAVVATLVAGLAACDSGKDEQDKDANDRVPEMSDTQTGTNDRNDKELLVPFSIGFAFDGKTVLLDKNGRPDPDWTVVKFPVKTEEIYAIRSTTYAVIKGSCKVMVEIAEDVWAEKTYPSPLCKKWGIAETN